MVNWERWKRDREETAGIRGHSESTRDQDPGAGPGWGSAENVVEGVALPCTPLPGPLHNVKDRGIWSLPPSSPAVPRQEIGLQVPTQGPGR